MLNKVLIEIFTRDLNQLKKEITLYPHEKDMWLCPEGISNSAGNLVLHLVGNLKHFIGHVLGETDYKRDRESEFSKKNIPANKILISIDEASDIVTKTLEKLDEKDFNKKYPIEVLKKPMTIGFFMVHLTTHLSYHLGQVNYHRRLIG